MEHLDFLITGEVPNFKKMTVSQLKEHIKKNRNKTNRKNIGGMKKPQLVEYEKELDNKKVQGTGLKDIFTIKKEYNNVSKRTLKKYGTWDVYKMTVVRTPIFSLLGKVGVFKKLMNQDTIYHLSLHISLKSPDDKYVLISVEKQDQINIKPNPKLKTDSEIREISMNNETISLNKLLENTQQYMKEKYFLYDAIKNNCQDYILAILKSNNIGSTSDVDFIKQLTTDLEGNFILRKTLNTLTDAGTRVSQLIGKGKCKFCDGCGYKTELKKL